MECEIRIRSNELLAKALKKWIGKTTRDERTKIGGLTEKENIELEELYSLLP